MRQRLAEFQLALMLLTRLPAGHLPDPVPPISRAVWAFPLIGAGLGLVMWITFSFAGALGLPPLSGALLALGVQAILTGALHEDGLADTADGFGGGRERTRKLEIMRDSHIGSYGVMALILVTALTASGFSQAASLLMCIAIGATSRGAMLLPMVFLPPAREDGLGQGASLQLNPTLMAPAILIILLAFIAPYAAIMMFLAALALLPLFQFQIGGQTGDTLGATQKLTECVGWLTAATCV